MNNEANVAYAKPKPGNKPNPIPTAEPATLALMETGAAGVGVYLFLRIRNKKK
jgi:hypothetical protein